jgi:hypothetical protein
VSERSPPLQKQKYCPPEYETRIHALTDLIRWGPSTFSHAEFSVLLFYAERTLTYGKPADSSSLAQITQGVYSRRSRERIRGGAGVKATSVKAANKSLSQRGFLIRRHALPGETRYRDERGNEPTEYEINWTALHDEFAKKKQAPLSHDVTKPLSRLPSKPLSRQAPHNRSKSSSEKKNTRGIQLTEGYGARNQLKPDVLPYAVEVTGTPRSESDYRSRSGSIQSNRELDDDEESVVSFATPKMELAHLVAQRGALLSEFEWHRITEALELRQIEPAQFIAFVRPHLLNPRTRNPIGMIKSKIRHYAAMTRPAVTESDKRANGAEPAEKCPICREVKGKGVIIDGDHMVACECATEEWRVKVEQQERERLRRAGHR